MTPGTFISAYDIIARAAEFVPQRAARRASSQGRHHGRFRRAEALRRPLTGHLRRGRASSVLKRRFASMPWQQP